MKFEIPNLKLVMAAIMIILSPSLPAHAPEQVPIYELVKYRKAANPLLKVARQKATIGIIPYYKINGKIYIFLGQELTGGKKEASGAFSDFGGSVKPDGKTILEHALREFREETMGQLKLNEDNVLKNGYLLLTKSDQGREIYYIFLKFSDKQYAISNKFHTPTVRLKASGVPNSYLEKEAFLWVRLEDLMPPIVPTIAEPTSTEVATPDVTKPATETKAPRLTPDNQRFIVHTPEGATENILIRGYFLRDCLQNQDLPGLLQKLL